MGHEVVLAPLLDIVPMEGAVIPDRDYQAIAFTSANGARALSGHVALNGLRKLPAFALGPQSADAARAAGFSTVTVAGGDGKGLAAHLAATLDPQDGDILHPAGRETAGDFTAHLERACFAVARIVVYAAEPRALSPGIAAGAHGVLLYSPRSAKLWRDAMKALPGDLVHFCLSHNVAAALPETCAKRIAASPEEEAMLALIGAEARELQNPTR
jgi:uroporphyrinogen-III synthase